MFNKRLYRNNNKICICNIIESVLYGKFNFFFAKRSNAYCVRIIYIILFVYRIRHDRECKTLYGETTLKSFILYIFYSFTKCVSNNRKKSCYYSYVYTKNATQYYIGYDFFTVYFSTKKNRI